MKLFESMKRLALKTRSFAKKAASAPPKQKNVLLQTYFTSLFGLILSVTMFLGTSFAWFTSEVDNGENEIYVGTLKVDFLKETLDETNTVKLLNLAKNEENPTATNKLFDGSIRWEPGFTALETVQIVNKGDLAFKYTLAFLDGTLAEPNGKTLSDVADNFEVWVFDHAAAPYTKPQNYKEIVDSVATNTTEVVDTEAVAEPTETNSAKSGWKHVGSLADVLVDGEMVFEGKMDVVRRDTQNPNPGTTDGVDTTHRYTIALHMNEDAESDVMGHRIKLNVKLLAYQLSSEKDAFGNDYDGKEVLVGDHEDLFDAINGGKNVILTGNIIIPAPEYCLTMEGNSLDGAGYTIEYQGGYVTDSNGTKKSVGVLNSFGGTISNVTIIGNKEGRALYMTELRSDLRVTNCDLSGEFAFNLNTNQKNANAKLYFKDTTFGGRVSYANAASHAYFNNCTYSDDVRPYGDSTIEGCTFITQGLDVTELVKANAKDETVTLKYCEYNGTQIDHAVIKSNGDGTVTITETKLLEMTTEQINGKTYHYIRLKSNS